MQQNIPPENEIDELDGLCVHFVCLDDQQPIGTARLIPDYDPCNWLGKLGRFAVIKEFRGMGVGRDIAAAVEVYARDALGLKGLVLHAQLSAEAFYKKLAYKTEGAPFLEEGIMHVCMRKML
ncbi:acetyltransferase, GNAT family protein [Dunaliella salina]|uniref:Acetyltransferase, GNAT family protein n=1 Tax=Dunaliella salina TaxID=3046 RepID=A0ABQ7GTK7_DUNSA|nr:acetyltransferase, GNAT family protein [Dunaliella salina]|eukprot:KAF5837930.1 acetyltransferase, GNAT family protein [Dunaliella salina]